MTVLYLGTRAHGGEAVVTADGELLPWRLDLVRHSPTGFEWGYGGSGPAQLALALLAHHTGDGKRAVRLHQRFKWDVVAPLSKASWALTGADIDAWLNRAAEARA